MQKRERLIHSYFDHAHKVHIIFVYNRNRDVVAEMQVSPEGKIKVLIGQVVTLEQTKDMKT